MKPKRTTFNVATLEGPAPRTGYVLGGFATRKEKYFWEFTHLATGLKLSTYPCHENKASALAHLEKLNGPDGLRPHEVEILAKAPRL
jgi:hypothetical protein